MPKPIFGGKSPSALPWKPLPLMEEYLYNLEVDERSGTYMRAVKVGLTHFGIFAEQEGIRHPDEIERMHLLRFQEYLNGLSSEQFGKPLSSAYRQQLMKYVRAWINWLLELEHISHNPWVKIKVGRAKKKPKPLEHAEVEALFDAHRRMAFNISPFFYHRRETMLVLLYAWGLRIHELQALTVTAMDMRLDFVTTINKGGGTKVLPYGTEMKQIVARWLNQRSKHAIPGVDSLLIDSSGNPLSSAMIYKVVTELGQRAGVTINPHRLRDTFGTTMLDDDVPIERIMVMMGHTNRAQTAAYSRVNDPKLKESHDASMGPRISRLTGGAA